MSSEADFATVEHRVSVLERERQQDREDLRENTKIVFKLTSAVETQTVKLDGMADNVGRVAKLLDGNGKRGLISRLDSVEDTTRTWRRVSWGVAGLVGTLIGTGIWMAITK